MSARTSIISGLEIAAQLSGVPYLGVAATILRGISDQCDKVQVHHEKAKVLKSKSQSLLALVENQSAFIQDDQMREAADELRPVLEQVQKRLNKYSQYSFRQRIMRGSEVQGGLESSLVEMDAALEGFKLKSHVRMHQRHDEAMSQSQSHNDYVVGLLHDLIQATAPEQRRDRLQELEAQPAEVRTQVFGALQERLRYIQDKEEEQERHNPDAMVVDRAMNDSPVPMTPRSMTRNGPGSSSPHITIAPQRKPTRHGEDYEVTSRIMLDLLKMGVRSKIPNLNGQVVKIGSVAQAGGVYSDVWLGEWLGGQQVALKALRNVRPTEKAIKRFESQVKIWIELQHHHILPFYGLCTDLMQNVSIVSAWQKHGNVRKFVEDHSDADKIRLMRGAAEGLAYLHSRGIVHGNVRCANILVSAEGDARICDFGMSKIVEEVTDNSASATLTAGGSARWLSPELIEGAETSPTFASDVYSFAMTVLECLTAKHPYGHCKRDANVIHEVITLKRFPPRPSGTGVDPWLTDELWRLMEDCWGSPRRRPSMAEVLVRMKAIEDARRLASWS